MTGWKQEPDLVPGRPILAVVAGAIAATALGVAIAWRLADCGGPRPHPATMPAEVSAVETTLFGERAQGIEDHRAAEAWLSSYGWVDRERGIVHIPIDAAIDLYLRRRAREEQP